MSTTPATREGRRLVAARAIVLAWGILVATGLTTVVAPLAAAAEEVSQRPVNGIFTLSGHGFGHGRGMSQWGAQGAAATGMNVNDILAFYYPGTVQAATSNPMVRVAVTADPTQVRVSSTDGLFLVESSGVRTWLSPAYLMWRLLAVGSQTQLQGYDAANAVWTPIATASGALGLSSAARFEATTGALRVWRADGSSTQYRGTITAVPGALRVTTVNTVPLESYLRGVVPSEMPPSFLPAALQTQAVAARTYAYRRILASSSLTSDVCDTTACQVYRGQVTWSPSFARTTVETTATDSAITVTSGTVLTYAGQVALTEYSASNGGWTASGGTAYTPVKVDPYDAVTGNTSARWSASLPAAVLEARYPAVGSVIRLVVTGRTGAGEWGGRVTTARIEGSAGSVNVTGEDLRAARPFPSFSDGLRSSWFVVDPPATVPGLVPPSLAPGDSVSSPSGGYQLVMKPDGNLVVRTVGGTTLWTSATLARQATLAVRSDGTVVILTAVGEVKWSVAVNSPGARLVIQDDGNLVLYSTNGQALWDSKGYAGRVAKAYPTTTEVTDLPPGAVAAARTGAATLVMQMDGNLVLYDRAGTPRWATNTFRPGSFAVAQWDGNFVLYAPNGVPLWTAGVQSPRGFMLMQDDGNLVLYRTPTSAGWDAWGFSGNRGYYP